MRVGSGDLLLFHRAAVLVIAAHRPEIGVAFGAAHVYLAAAALQGQIVGEQGKRFAGDARCPCAGLHPCKAPSGSQGLSGGAVSAAIGIQHHAIDVARGLA